MAAFIRGATNDGCVGCICLYVYFQMQIKSKCDNVNLEGAVRGNIRCTGRLAQWYQQAKPVSAFALISFWVKMMTELGDTTITEDKRKEVKKDIANVCYVCSKIDSKDRIFEKCGICKYYSYCGKKYQTYTIGRRVNTWVNVVNS
mmetsp:Transcript_27637/g.28162  ORF Transcript_27637/g.28162 Transcript_27637/m.28162 type:complete len:145 (+) Transcript_27637:287-721(+)